jgi:NAD(P)-dependent dehydrogenase (short-subunit alcohol dehydrogenase family)
MTNLSGKVAVVTGGSTGLGLGIVAALGAAGARVAIWSRREAVAEQSVADLASRGIEATSARCDVGSEEDVRRAMEQTLKAFGRVDIMVANAGGTSRSPFVETSLADWESSLRGNMTGTFLCFREGARHMIERGEGGALLAIGSVGAVQGQPELAPYCAAKAGLGGLVRALAVELAPHRIRCNVLNPGFTTNSKNDPENLSEESLRVTAAAVPVGRWAAPEEVAAAALFLADPALAFHTGATLFADGALSVMPPQLAVRNAAQGS